MDEFEPIRAPDPSSRGLQPADSGGSRELADDESESDGERPQDVGRLIRWGVIGALAGLLGAAVVLSGYGWWRTRAMVPVAAKHLAADEANGMPAGPIRLEEIVSPEEEGVVGEDPWPRITENEADRVIEMEISYPFIF
jgi:hypothetical protein